MHSCRIWQGGARRAVRRWAPADSRRPGGTHLHARKAKLLLQLPHEARVARQQLQRVVAAQVRREAGLRTEGRAG